VSDSDLFDRAIEKVLSDQSPRGEVAKLDPEERRLVQMAQRLRGSQGQSPSPEFVDRLHSRLFHQPRRVSRRAAVLSALGTLAAGVAAGIGLQHSREGSSTRPLKQQGLDVHNGKWFRVTDVAALPPGTVHAFTAGPVQGYLINREGEIYALSRICTHVGCSLNFDSRGQTLICPCHGAHFDLHGQFQHGPRRYIQSLPPLPTVRVRVMGQAVEAYGA
jgi:nitrite reductase/ring-hydroxylating ferredoxin subunit